VYKEIRNCEHEITLFTNRGNERIMVSFVLAMLVGLCWTLALAEAQCNAPTSILCSRNRTAIALDADLTEWTGVSGISTPLQQPYGGPIYTGGDATYKCLYSDTHLYLTMEIPGTFRFDSTTSEKCAAISTMFKIGEKATFVNMGGCPLALANQSACDNLMIPESCEDYRVVRFIHAIVGFDFSFTPLTRRLSHAGPRTLAPIGNSLEQPKEWNTVSTW
jgi:hypothetical protein